jgi:hypothetical protein
VRGVGGAERKKMTTPKCRHFPLRGNSGFPECISPLIRVPNLRILTQNLCKLTQMGRNATRPTGCPVGLDYLMFS